MYVYIYIYIYIYSLDLRRQELAGVAHDERGGHVRVGDPAGESPQQEVLSYNKTEQLN